MCTAKMAAAASHQTKPVCAETKWRQRWHTKPNRFVQRQNAGSGDTPTQTGLCRGKMAAAVTSQTKLCFLFHFHFLCLTNRTSSSLQRRPTALSDPLQKECFTKHNFVSLHSLLLCAHIEVLILKWIEIEKFYKNFILDKTQTSVIAIKMRFL